jgi:predicted N-acyltransferase
MSLDVRIAHSVEEIGQEAWDYLAGGRPFSSYRWYRYGETVLADNKPIYVVLSQRGEPLARATFWLRRQEALPLSSKGIRQALNALIRWRPLLVCQAPVAYAPGMILPETGLRDMALEAIARIAQSRAREQRASFFYWSYLEERDARCAGWPEAFNRLQMSEPLTRLTLSWPDFERYLRQLPRPVRKDYRRHCRLASEQSITVNGCRLSEQSSLDAGTLDEAARLISNVEGHHRSAHNPWARATLERAGMVDAVWLKAEIGNRLVGCGLLLGDGGHWMMTLLGLDYTVRYAYFQLVYAAIRCAMEQGAQVLWGGTGAYELKERLGFEVQPEHYTIFAAGGRCLQSLGRRLAHWSN